LDPPRFRLPDNFDSDRFEVWTLRLPRDFNLSDLHGARLPFTQQQNQRSDEVVDFTSRKGHQKFSLQWGDARESEWFRMILPRPHDGDSDDSDDDDDGTFLYPADIPFTRHASILHAIPQQSQFELAPSMENAPFPTEKNAVRHSYVPVPQKQGLKRRWTPLGGNTTVSTSLPLKRKMKSSQDNGPAKHKVIKTENNDDDATHPSSINHKTSTNRILKDDPDTLLSDGEKIEKAETDTPRSERKKMKREDDLDTPRSDGKKSKKDKKSEKKEKKKKKKMKGES
jgi:hypothetical protein